MGKLNLTDIPDDLWYIILEYFSFETKKKFHIPKNYSSEWLSLRLTNSRFLSLQSRHFQMSVDARFLADQLYRERVLSLVFDPAEQLLLTLSSTTGERFLKQFGLRSIERAGIPGFPRYLELPFAVSPDTAVAAQLPCLQHVCRLTFTSSDPKDEVTSETDIESDVDSDSKAEDSLAQSLLSLRPLPAFPFLHYLQAMPRLRRVNITNCKHLLDARQLLFAPANCFLYLRHCDFVAHAEELHEEVRRSCVLLRDEDGGAHSSSSGSSNRPSSYFIWI